AMPWAGRDVAPVLVAHEQQAGAGLLSGDRHDVLEELGLVERLRDREAEALAPECQRGVHVRDVELEEGEADGHCSSPARWSAVRSDSAAIVSVGLAQPEVGKSELP